MNVIFMVGSVWSSEEGCVVEWSAGWWEAGEGRRGNAIKQRFEKLADSAFGISLMRMAKARRVRKPVFRCEERN